jgi:hypothetical protein
MGVRRLDIKVWKRRWPRSNAEHATILADSPLPATALAKKRDATFHAQDATASAALALADDKWRKVDKWRQD